jgi:hypothetical protein
MNRGKQIDKGTFTRYMYPCKTPTRIAYHAMPCKLEITNEHGSIYFPIKIWEINELIDCLQQIRKEYLFI